MCMVDRSGRPDNLTAVTGKGEMMKVISYSNDKGETIDLTQAQVALLQNAGVWPTDQNGCEYCQVSHGLHFSEMGETFSDDEITRIINGENAGELMAA